MMGEGGSLTGGVGVDERSTPKDKSYGIMVSGKIDGGLGKVMGL